MRICGVVSSYLVDETLGIRRRTKSSGSARRRGRFERGAAGLKLYRSRPDAVIAAALAYWRASLDEGGSVYDRRGMIAIGGSCLPEYLSSLPSMRDQPDHASR